MKFISDDTIKVSFLGTIIDVYHKVNYITIDGDGIVHGFTEHPSLIESSEDHYAWVTALPYYDFYILGRAEFKDKQEKEDNKKTIYVIKQDGSNYKAEPTYFEGYKVLEFTPSPTIGITFEDSFINIPEWVEYITVDCCGNVEGFYHKPILETDGKAFWWKEAKDTLNLVRHVELGTIPTFTISKEQLQSYSKNIYVVSYLLDNQTYYAEKKAY